MCDLDQNIQDSLNNEINQSQKNEEKKKNEIDQPNTELNKSKTPIKPEQKEESEIFDRDSNSKSSENEGISPVKRMSSTLILPKIPLIPF